MLVSVCMIVRNEEDVITRAIASTVGLADEIVVVDTGSTDGTTKIINDLGCYAFSGGDRMNKSKERNFAAENSKGDWTVILDADEEIADPVGLREFLENTDADAAYIKLAYMDGSDRQTLSYSQMRCWRRGIFEYKYRAHELPVPTGAWGKLAHTEFIWEHRPPGGRDWKLNYTLERLLLDVEENPEDPRPLFYLGRQYKYLGLWDEAIDTLEQYLAGITTRDKPDALALLAACYGANGDTKQQIRLLFEACAFAPERRDWYGQLATLFHAQSKWNVAIGLLKCALELTPPSFDYVNHYYFGSAVYDLLARCLWKVKRYEEGKGYAIKAVELEPGSERLKKNLLWFESACGDMDAFYTLYGPEIHTNAPRHKAIAELVEGPMVLDVGCGTGDLLLLLQEDGNDYDLYGTETSSVAMEMARDRGVDAFLMNHNGIPAWQFDTIIASQMLEHVDNDEYMIDEMVARLSPQGQLIVSVPNNGAIPSPDHKRNYTEQSLRKLLEPIGTPVLHDWVGKDSRILMSVRRE